MFLAPVLVKYMEENLDTTKPRYNEPLALRYIDFNFSTG